MPARRCAILASLALAVAGLVCVAASPASATTMGDELGPWLFWNSPAAQQSYSALSQRVTPHNVAPTIYWSTQWFWNGAPDGGYAGIQTDGDRADGSVGPMAIFSIWDATHAIAGAQASCIPFGGEGVGMSCRMPFTVTAGDSYRTDVAITRTDANGNWWHATITDETSHAVADLGEIAAPATATAQMPASFVEYFGRAVGCGQEPLVVSDFAPPVVTPAGTNTPLPSSYLQATKRTCARALVASTPDVTTMTFGGPQPSFVPNAHATAVSGVVPVAWDTAVSDGGTPITNYVVQASNNLGATWNEVARTDGTARAASITGLAPSSWAFRVAAVNSAGTGAFSDPTPPVLIASATLSASMTNPGGSVALTPTFLVAWRGAGPRGVDHYVVQRRIAPWNVGFGPWANWLSSTTTLSGQYPGTYGRSYCFRVRAVDASGATSPYSAQKCTTVPLRAAALAYSSGWSRVTDPTLFSGYGYRTAARNATATRTAVDAKRLYLVATRCPACGKVAIRWNGATIATLDLSAPTTQVRQSIGITTFAAPQVGTVTVVVTSPTGKAVTAEGLAVSQT